MTRYIMTSNNTVQESINKYEAEIEILEDAAKRIVKRGWIQGARGNSTQGYCMSGAIYATMYSTMTRKDCLGNFTEPRKHSKYRHILYSVLLQEIAEIDLEDAITAFNDDRHQTKQGVVSALRAFAMRRRTRLETIRGITNA